MKHHHAGTPGGRRGPARTIAHIRRAIRRYRRDLALMLGERAPAEGNVDDLAILERFRSNADQTGLINEWVLRIKTLEAMIELLREEGGEETERG